MKEIKLKVILMDDESNGVFEDSGLRGVRRLNERYGLNCEVVTRTFATEGERDAYISALYDITNGSYSQYAILDNRCKGL